MIKFICAAFFAVFLTVNTSVAGCVEDSLATAEIYPTVDVVPENILRIYVYFPRPMAEEFDSEHISLLDERGVKQTGVFLENREDLWSPDRRRLTLFFNPGRVKTGLNAHRVLGRALQPEHNYTIKVSGALKDVDGCALGQDVEYTFHVEPADFQTPAPGGWALEVPVKMSKDPLIVKLGSAHDHLSLAYRLRVVDANGDFVHGRIALGSGERSWIFTPERAWRAAPYALIIDERLEDLAGNRPGVLFDRPIDALPEQWQRRIAFVPGINKAN